MRITVQQYLAMDAAAMKTCCMHHWLHSGSDEHFQYYIATGNKRALRIAHRGIITTTKSKPCESTSAEWNWSSLGTGDVSNRLCFSRNPSTWFPAPYAGKLWQLMFPQSIIWPINTFKHFLLWLMHLPCIQFSYNIFLVGLDTNIPWLL